MHAAHLRHVVPQLPQKIVQRRDQRRPRGQVVAGLGAKFSEGRHCA
jgi:hypothetical protein